LTKRLRVSAPYTTAISKNVRVKYKKGRGAYTTPEARKHEESLARSIEAGTEGFEIAWVPAPLHIRVRVDRPDFRLDPVNFIDAICDAVSKGTGIDDRWFSVSLDWRMHHAPRIHVEITQEHDEPHRPCVGCHRVMPTTEFYGDGKGGWRSRCRPCEKAGRRTARKAAAVLDSAA
jgi:hypothetical protein